MTATVLAVLGSGPNVGKTSVVANLTWALHAEGYRVAPFKALSVDRGDPWGHTRPGSSLAATMLAWAAGHEPTADHCPYIARGDTGPAVLHEVETGRVVTDRVPVRGADAVDLSGLDGATFDAIRERCRERGARLAADADLLLVEGAGAVGDLPAHRDLANLITPADLGARALIVHDGRTAVDPRRAGRLARLARTAGIPVDGVVVSRVARAPVPDEADRVAAAYGVPVVGVFPEIPDAARYFDSRAALESLWDRTRGSAAQRELVDTVRRSLTVAGADRRATGSTVGGRR